MVRVGKEKEAPQEVTLPEARTTATKGEAVDTMTIAGKPETRKTEPQPAYVWRGRGLFKVHREDLEYLDGGRWLVPSGSESAQVYEVRVGTRPERSNCPCIGFGQHKHCSHVVCASIAHRRSAVCDSCGERRYFSELTEVQEDHESLAWFPGDLLCEGCIRDHGGIS
jgi:hypothetical protein